MKSLQELQILIQKELNTINFPIEPKNLYDPIKYVLDIGGKNETYSHTYGPSTF